MKVVISLTTIPDRLEYGFPYKNVKHFYYNQLVKPDLIIINIPAVSAKGVKYNREKANEFSNISPNIVVNWGVEDLGPITKLIPTLEFLNNNNMKDAYIILIDDDCMYGNDLVKNLMDIKRDNPDKMAIGYEGIVYSMFIPIRLSHLSISDFTDCDALETYAGVLYDTKLFLPYDDFKKFAKDLPDYVKKADDIIIGAWIRKNNEKLYKNNSKVKVDHNAYDTEELNKINLTSGNTRSINYFAHRLHYGNKCIIIQYSYILLFILFISLILTVCIKYKHD